MLPRYFILLAFLFVSFHGLAQRNEQEAHVEAGKIKEEQGYLDAALSDYKQGLPLPAALNGVASIEVTTGKYDSVLNYLDRSRKLDRSSNNLITNYQVVARYWLSQNQYDSALAYFQTALDLSTLANDKKNQAVILSNIGGIHFSHEPDIKVARDYFTKSNAVCDSSLHYDILSRNYARLANSFMVTGDGGEAKRYLKRAKVINDISNNLPVKAYILSSMAIILFEEKKYDEVIEMMKEPIRIKRELGQLRQLQNDLINLAETQMMIRKFDDAEKSLNEAFTISTSLKDDVYLKYYYERASMLDSLRGNYKGAYSNLKRAMAYKDSVFSKERLRDVREIQEKYEGEQKEKVIAEKELEIEHQKFSQAVIVGISIIAALIFIALLVYVRARNKQRVHHARLHAIVNTQEEVQQRIARDLHDGLVQILGAAKMSLQAVTPESDKSILQKHIRNASEIMDEAVTEARSISHQVLPYSLLKDGLISALEDLFSRSLASYEFNRESENVSVSEQVAINIYRIAQELVNNVLKHAETAHVGVSLTSTNQQLNFIFSDNGKGYDTNKPTVGAGLTNIITRAELIGGTIIVTSIIGKGTRTELTVPL